MGIIIEYSKRKNGKKVSYEYEEEKKLAIVDNLSKEEIALIRKEAKLRLKRKKAEDKLFAEAYKKKLELNRQRGIEDDGRICISGKRAYSYKDIYATKDDCGSIDIRWKRIYDRLVNGFIRRDLKKNGIEELESHHIIPRCLAGGDCFSNLVVVTEEEHTLLHCLLSLSYPEHYGLLNACIRRIDEGISKWELLECFNNKDKSRQRITATLRDGVLSGIIEDKELRERLGL